MLTSSSIEFVSMLSSSSIFKSDFSSIWESDSSGFISVISNFSSVSKFSSDFSKSSDISSTSSSENSFLAFSNSSLSSSSVIFLSSRYSSNWWFDFISIFHPVNFAASLTFWPSLPIARESW